LSVKDERALIPSRETKETDPKKLSNEGDFLVAIGVVAEDVIQEPKEPSRRRLGLEAELEREASPVFRGMGFYLKRRPLQLDEAVGESDAWYRGVEESRVRETVTGQLNAPVYVACLKT
jgi:hypothetical protein